MENKIIEIIIQTHKTPKEQANEIIKLFNNKVFEVGQRIKVESRISGHEFELNEIVIITDYDPTENAKWLCSNGKRNWWLSEDEAIII
jgi:ribosome maturation protein Sdo1